MRAERSTFASRPFDIGVGMDDEGRRVDGTERRNRQVMHGARDARLSGRDRSPIEASECTKSTSRT